MLRIKKTFIEIILYRAKVELSAEGSRNYLSFLWWLIDPLVELFIFYTVFGLVLQRGGVNFVTELLTGVFTIRLFISATNSAPSLFIDNEHVLLSVNIPKFIIPAAHTLSCCVKYIFILLLLYFFLLVLGSPLSFNNLFVVPITMLYVCFTLGVVMILSGLTPMIPDLVMIYPKITMLLFWVSGVFFNPQDYIPEKYIIWYYSNPIAGFIKSYRDCLLHDKIEWELNVYLFIISILFLIAGYSLLAFLEKKLPKVVAQR